MNDKLEKIYQYLSTQNIKNFPTTYPDFETLMQDDDKAGKIHSFLLSKKVKNVDTDFNAFSDYIGRKKKSPSSVYLETLAEGTPATKALQDLWTSQDKSPKVQPPLRLGVTIPTKKEEIYASEPDITSVLRANQKLPDYLSQEKDRIVSETDKGLRDELKALQDTYEQKIKDNPEDYDKLNEEFKKKVETTAELRGKGLDIAINSLYTKGKEYEYLDSSDVKLLSERAREIASVPDIVGTKEDKLKTLANQFMARMGGAPPDVKAQLSREINDVIAQNSLFDEKGNPTIYGWKKEAISKKNKLVEARDKMLKEHPELANIVTDYKVRTSDIGKQFNAMIHASDMYDRIISLPDDGGNFLEGLKSTGRQIATLGIGDLFEASNIKKIADKQREGKQTPEEQLLLDAYGMYQVTQNAEELSKAYKTGQRIGGSIAWMGQFALTSPVGAIGEKISERTAIKLLGQNLKKKATEGVISNLVKTGIKGSIKGAGGAIARTPLLTGGYTDALTRMTGQPKLTKDGTWVIDEATIEPVMQAIAKGLYSNFTDAFGESAGGWFAGSKFNKIIGTKLGLTKIPKGVAQIFDKIGMQPIGELGEEYLTTLMQTPVMGDQTLAEAFSGENMWDTAVQVGLMSGFFGGLAAPSVISENVRRGRAADMIKVFGKDNVSALRTAIENNDKQAFANAIKKSFEGKTAEDLGMPIEKAQKRLVQYANYLAQVKGHEVAQEVVEDAVASEITTTDKGKATTEVGALKVPQEVKNQLQKEQAEVKTEEETKDAEGTGKEITETSEPTRGVVEGEESGLRVRDTAQDRVEAPQGETESEIVVAPFYNTQVKSPEEADALRQSPEYQQHIQNIKDKASALGFEVTDLSENIGHYTNDAGEKITELSNSITIKGTYEQAQQLAAVLGATTPEVQETTIAGHYVKAGDVNHESDEVNIEVADFKGALAVLDEMDIDYTLNQSKNTIKFLDFSKGEDLDFKNKVITFASKLAEKGIKYGNEERRPTQSKLIDATERRGILGRLNEEAVQRGQGGAVLRGITEEATQRNEEFIRKRAEVAPVQKPVEAKTETTEAVSPPSGVTPPTEDKVDEKAPKEAPEREKSYFKRVVEGIKPSKALKEAVTKLGLTYRVLSHAETSKDVDYILSELGMEKAEEAVRDLNNGIGAATRMGVMLRIGFHYDRMAEDFRKKGDIEQENYYRDKATALANWKDVTGRDWGRGISYEGSVEFMEQMSPITQVSKTKKEVRSNRDSQLEKERTKEDLSKINKAHKDANAESADELINSEEHKRRKTRTKGITQPKAKSVSKENIQKERDFQKKKWEELRRAWGDLRKQQKGGTVGFAANAQEEQVVRILGEIFRSKVRQGMYSVEAILEQMAKEFKKFIGEDIDKEVLRGYIPKEIDGKPTEQALAENERQSAAEKLASRITKLLESPKTPKNDPVKQMVETLFGKVKEKGINEKIKFERKSNIERIKEAIENKEQYADVWEKAKKEVDSRIDYNPDLSDEQKQEYRDRLQAFYDEIIGKPYSETNVVGAIKETAKAEEIDIDSVIKQHYTVVDALGRTLAEKIVDATGITGEEAEALAKDIQAQFNKIATAKKRKWLERDIAARAKRATNIKQAKVEAEKLIELTNMGAFSDAEFREIYADAWGFPKLTDTQVKELERLAGEIAKKEGFKRNEAMQDYLNYVAKLPGLDLGEVALTIWYANVLSGMRTQGKNVLGSLTNTIGELVTSLVYNMWHGNYSAFAYEFAALWGAKKEAFTEFKYVMKTGYSPVRGNKYETSNTAELWKFTGSWKNPMNYIKYYPGRFMAATDAFFYVGLKEMRAHELAMKEAISRNPNGKPTIMKEDWAKANEILGKTEERVREAVKRATEEGLKGVELKKRIYELMEEGRPQEFIAQSAQFASRGTFNYHPEGAIGSVAEMLSRFTTNYGKISIHNPFTGRTYTMRAAKLLIPFTRIVANVANTAIDYTPIGWLVRARKGYIGTEGEKRFYREYTEEEREKLRIKSLLGTTAMATLFFLSEPPDDPEEEPVIMITANGAGKYSKSQQTQDWQPYSIKIGKRWWSYQYTPLFLALAPIGFIRDQQRFGTYKPDEPWLDKVLAPLIFMSSVITDMSAISQAASLLKVVSDKSTQSIDYYIKSTGAGIVKGFIAPKAIEQAKQYYDDIADNPQKYASSFQNNLIKGMPFTKFAVGELPDRYNYWGYPVETDAFQLVARDNSDDFTRFLTRHKIYPEIPDQRSDYCSFFDQEDGIVRQMNDIEYMDFVRTAGSRAKELIEQVLMPQESAMESEDLRKEAKQIGSDTYALVKQEMFGWGEFRSSKDKDGNDNAEKWDILKANRAIQLPVTRPIEWFAEGEGGDMVKQIATEDEMRKYNQVAMEAYANYIIELLSDPDIEDFKKIPDIINGGSLYDTEIKRRWTAAKSDAKVVIVEGRGKAE